jgi:hypothetical protein
MKMIKMGPTYSFVGDRRSLGNGMDHLDQGLTKSALNIPRDPQPLPRGSVDTFL